MNHLKNDFIQDYNILLKMNQIVDINLIGKQVKSQEDLKLIKFVYDNHIKF